MCETCDIGPQVIHWSQSTQAGDGQVCDVVNLVLLPERHQPFACGDIHLLNLHALVVFVLNETGLPPSLEVGDHHVFTHVQEGTSRVQSDEPHPTCDERCH